VRISSHALRLGLFWAVLATIVAIAAALDVAMIELTKDPIAIFESDRFYYGLLSQLGVLLWCTAAAVTLFASRLLVARDSDGTPAAYLGALGVVTVVLMFDDRFMIHELVGPVFLGIPELALYSFYALALGATLLVFRRHIVDRTASPLLAIALGCFGASTLIDVLPLRTIGTDVEDGMKLTGILAYAYYCVTTAAAALNRTTQRRPAPRATAPTRLLPSREARS
jgi:hypothetical protein